MRKLLNIFQILLIWIWTLITCLTGLFLLIFIDQKQTIYITSQFWAWFILGISGAKVKVEGLENVPINKPVIFVANHESSYDIPAIFQALPVSLFYLVKAELKKIPFFGWYLGAVGMVFVDRANHKNAMNSLVTAGNEIKKGKNIISFPEGSRSRDGKLKRFKRGSFILSLQNNIDIVPIAVVGSREVNAPGYDIKPGVITVRIGAIINASDFDKELPDVMAKYAESKIRELRGVDKP